MAESKLKNILLELSSPEEQEDLLMGEIDRLVLKLQSIDQMIAERDKRHEEKLKSLIDTVKDRVDEFFSSIKLTTDQKVKKLNEIIKGVEDKIDVADISLSREIKESKKQITDYAKSLIEIQEKNKIEILELISDIVKDRKAIDKEVRNIKDSIKQLREELKKEIISIPRSGGAVYTGFNYKTLTGAIDGVNTTYTFTGNVGNGTMVVLRSRGVMSEGLITFHETIHYTKGGSTINFTTPIDSSYSGFTLNLVYIQ